MKSTGNVSKIGVWGRSMGAATSIMQSFRDNNISWITIDSSFWDLKKLAFDLAKQFVSLPQFILGNAV